VLAVNLQGDVRWRIWDVTAKPKVVAGTVGAPLGTGEMDLVAPLNITLEGDAPNGVSKNIEVLNMPAGLSLGDPAVSIGFEGFVLFFTGTPTAPSFENVRIRIPAGVLTSNRELIIDISDIKFEIKP
jgi:hypothetical protein